MNRIMMTHLDTTHPRFVVCAALRNDAGHIICGARHFDPLMHAQIRFREDRETWKVADQGFIDNFGTFMDRETAHTVATQAGQIRYRFGEDDKELYSENLY